jgi:hypothetical protein
MSAIATPMVHSTAVIGGSSDLVNVEVAQAVTRVTVDPVTNQRGSYDIVFHFGGGTPAVHWKFVDEAARDAEYALLIAIISTVVA